MDAPLPPVTTVPLTGGQENPAVAGRAAANPHPRWLFHRFLL
jgi:hypothetical protein